ncbi:MAG: hypothetical protein ACREK8_04280 [Gemmatimonadales bacterium]
MPRSTEFAARSAVSALCFGAGLALIRVASKRPKVPVVALVAVAIVAGVLLEFFRWQRGRYAGRISVDQVRMVAAVAVLIWGGGLWIDFLSADRGSVVIGGTIAVAAVIYTYSFLPHHRAV